ncbi:hypothetical protein CW354_16760 [Marinicaulis flavus]|uniref:Uncharacterized protein n=1 Tax=Hyphococcus luteus TaxID=2058213 RepID=A0A2S7K0P1_9PROT|nr:hypothetical protein CW354_16760 [Marinicaulis flavus]
MNTPRYFIAVFGYRNFRQAVFLAHFIECVNPLVITVFNHFNRREFMRVPEFSMPKSPSLVYIKHKIYIFVGYIRQCSNTGL